MTEPPMTEERLKELEAAFLADEGAHTWEMELVREVRALQAARAADAQLFADERHEWKQREEELKAERNEAACNARSESLARIRALEAELARRDACAMLAAAEFLEKKAAQHAKECAELDKVPGQGRLAREHRAESLNLSDLAAELRAAAPVPMVTRETALNASAIAAKAAKLYERDWGGWQECVHEAQPITLDTSIATAALARAEKEAGK